MISSPGLPLPLWVGLAWLAAACSLQMPKEGDLFARDTGRGASAWGGVDAASKGEQKGGATPTQGSSRAGDDAGEPERRSGTAWDGGALWQGGQGGRTADSGGAFSNGGNVDRGGTPWGGDDAERGLVAHFPFDETSGDTAANLKDPSKNGSYVGSCTHPTGRDGLAVAIRNMDGLVAATDWVELPAGLLSGLSATTVAIWLRDLSTAREGGRIFDFSLGTAEEIYFSPDETNSTTSVEGGHLGGIHCGAVFVDLWTANPLTDKAWHHVAIAWSAASIDLYVDGRRIAGQANPGVVPSDLGTTSPDWLGRTLNDGFISLYAEMDDLRIYDRALTAAQIGQLYDEY